METGRGGEGEPTMQGIGGIRFQPRYSFPPIRQTPLSDKQLMSILICLRERFFVNITVYREFKTPQWQWQWERQKSNSLKSQKNNSACASCFLYIYVPLLHDHEVKMPSFMFYGGREQVMTKFSFSFQNSSLAFEKVSKLDIFDRD